jgi:hypothetical protein
MKLQLIAALSFGWMNAVLICISTKNVVELIEAIVLASLLLVLGARIFPFVWH